MHFVKYLDLPITGKDQVVRNFQVAVTIQRSNSGGLSGKWWYTGTINGQADRWTGSALMEWEIDFFGEVNVESAEELNPGIGALIRSAYDAMGFVYSLDHQGKEIRFTLESIGFAVFEGAAIRSGQVLHWSYDFRKREYLCPEAGDDTDLVKLIASIVDPVIHRGR